MKAHRPLGLIATAAALVLGGCLVGPNYKAPAVPAPPAYSDSGHNGDWASAKPADAADRGAWWAVYQDPELNDLEQRCASANQNIAAALHVYEQAHDLVRVNRAALYPTVSIGGSASRNRISNTTPLRPAASPADYWEFLIPLNISWEPDLWGGVRRQIESSAANAQASAADLADTRLSLQGMLAVTFLQLRGLDLQAQLLRSTLDTYTQTLQLTQALRKGGLVTEIDVQEAQAQLEEARAQLIDLIRHVCDDFSAAVYRDCVATLVVVRRLAVCQRRFRMRVAPCKRQVRVHQIMVGLAGGESPNVHREDVADAFRDETLRLGLLDPVESPEVKNRTVHALAIDARGDLALVITQPGLRNGDRPPVRRTGTYAVSEGTGSGGGLKSAERLG